LRIQHVGDDFLAMRWQQLLTGMKAACARQTVLFRAAYGRRATGAREKANRGDVVS
jgi:hypothetical protein